MVGYFIDLLIVAVLVIGFTALNGVIGNSIGEKLFGGKKKNIHVDASVQTQTGWKQVGGK
ncbi:hypothetical protein [Bacillus massiliigorillae]|uniref:hypothetical protein n=1 Tax=Bacillus massiliigorillae TaxID=1243664 RepID=UPI0003A07293|nr:hypothetical protein [Bacillus massiliigorillae]